MDIFKDIHKMSELYINFPRQDILEISNKDVF